MPLTLASTAASTSVSPARLNGSGAPEAFIESRPAKLAISLSHNSSELPALNFRLWDFLFYAAFGLVVTSFVRIAGVLLVFSYLIAPAVCGINLAQRIGNRLLIGWIIALIGGIAGLFLSFWWDLPSGAAIVCTFGALLIIISIYGLLRARSRRDQVR